MYAHKTAVTEEIYVMYYLTRIVYSYRTIYIVDFTQNKHIFHCKIKIIIVFSLFRIK